MQGTAGKGLGPLAAIVIFVAGISLSASRAVAFAFPPLKKIVSRYETEGDCLSALAVAFFGLFPAIAVFELLDAVECDFAFLFVYAALVLFFFASLLLRYDLLSPYGGS